jgi:predicted ester cyclase
LKAVFIITVVLLAGIPCAGADASPPGASTLERRNAAVATRVFEEIFNQGRFDVASEIYAPEFRNHGRLQDITLREDQEAVHWEKQAFPDLKMTIDLLLANGEFVTVVWTFQGTHTGLGAGLPPTGAKVAMRGITIWRIVGGRILEEWTSYNELSPYLQVARHVKWFLLGGLVVAIIAVVIMERLLSRLFRLVWRRLRSST